MIGGGPAGLMAAEVLSAAGVSVTIYERMPSVARKLLIAGRGGLNITHSEAFDDFMGRYTGEAAWLRPMIEAFPPAATVAWMAGLGQESFVGSSGRVFPKAMKASPLLRAWLARLNALGVTIRTRTEWRGWDGAALAFDGPDGAVRATPDMTVLALGGASWPKLGSDGRWVETLKARGIGIASLAPANMGVDVAWSAPFKTRFAGEPVKNIASRVTVGAGGMAAKITARGDAVVTSYGLEGGVIYVVSHPLRDAMARGAAPVLTIDLRPDMDEGLIADRLTLAAPGQSSANVLRKAVKLSPLAINLLREGFGRELPREAKALAQAIKALPLRVTGVQGMARAISSAGGVMRDAVEPSLMLRALPGVFVAGEMLDWSAPTGGYLLQASLASGVAAARGALAWLERAA